MAVGNKGSRTSRAGSTSRRRSSADGRDIGWGFGPDEEEAIFLRRVLFSVLVAVVACMGAWFLLTNIAGRDNSGRVLSVADSAPQEARSYTVRLCEFPASRPSRSVAEKMAGSESIRALADGHEVSLLEFPNGRMALCVGWFDSDDSPELRRLLARVREYAEDGRRMFADASVSSFPE